MKLLQQGRSRTGIPFSTWLATILVMLPEGPVTSVRFARNFEDLPRLAVGRVPSGLITLQENRVCDDPFVSCIISHHPVPFFGRLRSF